MPRKPRTPSYRLHKPSGQTAMTLDGKDFYLGPHGIQVSRNRSRNFSRCFRRTAGCRSACLCVARGQVFLDVLPVLANQGVQAPPPLGRERLPRM